MVRSGRSGCPGRWPTPSVERGLFVNGAPQTLADPGGLYRDVEIVWAQNGKETVLARVDADANNQLRATVAVPAAAPPGLATLNARSVDDVILVVHPADP